MIGCPSAGRAGGIASSLFPVAQRRHFDRQEFGELRLAQSRRRPDGAHVDRSFAARARNPAHDARQACQPANALLAQFACGLQHLDEYVVAHRGDNVRQ